MLGSRSITAQPASPSAASQVSKAPRITLATAARTALESSTISTRGLSTVASFGDVVPSFLSEYYNRLTAAGRMPATRTRVGCHAEVDRQVAVSHPVPHHGGGRPGGVPQPARRQAVGAGPCPGAALMSAAAGAAPGNGSLLSRGMLAVMVAQFLSAAADNALLFGAIALLKAQAFPEWSIPVLQEFFAAAFIVLAPFAGPVADSLPKGRVMLLANGLKLAGA